MRDHGRVDALIDLLARVEAGELGDPLPVLAYVAGRGAVRRRRAERRPAPRAPALAAGGDPRRELGVDDRAVKSLAADLGRSRAATARGRRSTGSSPLSATCPEPGRRRSSSPATSTSRGGSTRSACSPRSSPNDARRRRRPPRRDPVRAARVLRASSTGRATTRWRSPRRSDRAGPALQDAGRLRRRELPSSSSRPTRGSTCGGSGKRAALADRAKAERATGYVAGGISPLGQRRPLPTTVDESALGFDTILVSAGRRGLQLEVAPPDLIRTLAATTRALAA